MTTLVVGSGTCLIHSYIAYSWFPFHAVHDRFRPMSQNCFSSCVHFSHTSRHSSNLFGDGGSAAASASILSTLTEARIDPRSDHHQHRQNISPTYTLLDSVLIFLSRVVVYPLPVRVSFQLNPGVRFQGFAFKP